MTCHRVTGEGCIWEGISLVNAWMPAMSVSQSFIMVCLKEKV